MEAIGAVATSKTVARIMNNRKADYNVDKEASALIHELSVNSQSAAITPNNSH